MLDILLEINRRTLEDNVLRMVTCVLPGIGSEHNLMCLTNNNKESDLQKRTATKSVSSTIFVKILALTSSMRSGKSIASKLVRKSNTFSSSIRSPKIKQMSYIHILLLDW